MGMQHIVSQLCVHVHRSLINRHWFRNAGRPQIRAKLTAELIQQLSQTRDDFRVFRQQVVLFADVVSQVVERSRWSQFLS